jgi:hypothetical protein
MRLVILAVAIVVIAQTTDAQPRVRAVRAGVNLFSAPLDPAQLQPEQLRRYRTYEALPSTLRLRMSDIMAEPNQTPVLTLSLFEARSYVATRTKLEETTGGYTWEGVLDGDGGRVILVVRGSQITGWIWATRLGLRDEFFAISAIGGRRHIIRQTNQDWFNSVWPGCNTGVRQPTLPNSTTNTLPEDYEGEEAKADPADRSVPNDLSRRKVAASSLTSCVTSVMVVYTPAAQNAHGSIPELAAAAVAATNTSYRNSDLDGLALKLVGTMLVNYTESGTMTGDTSTDLLRLKETSDGWMDDVHSMRSSLGADLVVLVVNDLHSLGILGQAWQIKADHETAFAVVDWQGAADNLTFAHEVGHLQGARHHDDPSTSPYEYGHGTCREWPFNYKTIMGTATCHEDRVPYWSNPDVTYKSRKTGDSDYRNNARVLRETSCRNIQKTLALLSYQGPNPVVPPRVITAFESGGIYSSPGGLYLGGGCTIAGACTISVYPGSQKVVAMISHQTRVITAFEGGGIYSSPDGLNLGGGGSTTVVYPGPQRVRAMLSYQGRVITAFEDGSIYSSPGGRDLGGGGCTNIEGCTIAVYPGPQKVRAMLSYQGRVITAFENGSIYSSPGGLDLGGGGCTNAGGCTIAVYPGPQRVTAMLSYKGSPDPLVPPRIITAFENGSIYSSPGGLDLGGGGCTNTGGCTIAVYPGPQRVTAMLSYQGSDPLERPRVITAFDSGGIYSSPGGLDLGGGGCTNAGGCTIPVYPGSQKVIAMISHQTRVITAFEGGGIYSSPDGLNLGGGGNTISVYPPF